MQYQLSNNEKSARLKCKMRSVKRKNPLTKIVKIRSLKLKNALWKIDSPFGKMENPLSKNWKSAQ
jgi:hypothetical protein